ncbi:hypothetical protein [Mangrovibacterium diazotrophicum]|uniref:Uncharacterized protein n=1 Tax=Mangrovibacterium diazotrophicum TaxID=1261403 RepID=A0A419W3Z1_9BACT|nr:hypothetical protein [Mangrovibacterium diazotrophicum]RKD90171.1 hypothetical protein BC643_0507 [Mangrovibacterium diazotrophicum]
MENVQRNERILVISVGLVVLSILLMFPVIQGILKDTTPGANPTSATIGISLAIAIRLVFIAAYVKVIRANRRNSKNRKGEYIGIGILLIIFGLVYMDGAFAFLSHDNMLYVSVLMFTSIGCEFVAALMMITLFFLKPRK